MDRDKKFHALVIEKGVTNALKERYSNLTSGQFKAVKKHANDLVDNNKIMI